jgi:dATP pyrophosphohydrolase
VLVVVYRGDGMVLLLRRCQPRDYWQSVTGGLEWDEASPAQAAQRELVEELGVSTTAGLRDWHRKTEFPILPPWRARYDPVVTRNTEHLFSFELPAHREPVLNPGEHDTWRWLPATAAARAASSPTNRDAILRLHDAGLF